MGHGKVNPQKMTPETCRSYSVLDKEYRKKVSAAMRQSVKTRQEIAEELSRIVGQKITLQKLNEWAAPSGGRNLPGRLIRPFSQVVGNDLVQRFVMSRRLLDMVRLGEMAKESDGLLGTYGPKRGYRRKKGSGCGK